LFIYIRYIFVIIDIFGEVISATLAWLLTL